MIMMQFSEENIIEVYSNDDRKQKQKQMDKIPRRQRNNLLYQSTGLLECSFNLESRQKWNEDKKGIT